MTDRFKFRVFNKANDKYDNDTFNFRIVVDMNGNCFINEDGGCDIEFDNDIIIEQCTGLKDKNGNLVYEGDILIDKYSCLVEIIYQKNAMFQALQKNGVKGAEFYTSYSLEPEYIKNSEVIGNIHENKELLIK